MYEVVVVGVSVSAGAFCVCCDGALCVFEFVECGVEGFGGVDD